MTSSQSEIDWRRRAAAIDRDCRPLIAGEAVDASGSSVERTDPADGSAGPAYRAADAGEVERAVAAASACVAGGELPLPPAGRRRALLALADLMDRDAHTLGLLDSLDMGKPIAAAVMEAHIAASLCRYFGEMVDKVYSGQSVPAEIGTLELHLRRPLGVVAAIVPWNYPVINATLKLAPALAAGNAVILKPSELSPGSALHIGRLAVEAGLPTAALSVLPGTGATGAALAQHPGIDAVTFTGSTATGSALMQAASGTLKRLMLECGGKSPELVFADARELGVEAIAQAIVGGVCANQGQLCVARTRLLIERPLYDDLVQAVADEMARVQAGHPLDYDTRFGPLASPAQHQRVRRYVDQAQTDGAQLRVDGRALAGTAGGCYLGPTLITQAAPDSAVAQEEVFGPVLCVFPFDDEAHAVALANDSRYGLAATVWTRDLARAHRLASSICTGKLRITTTTQPRMGAGWAHESEPCRQSGFGVEGGIKGLESYTRLQAVQIDY